MDSVAFRAFEKYLSEHREEHWASALIDDDLHWCIDDLPHLNLRELSEAIVYPVIHMHLLAWWLAHAWRFIDLAGTAIKSLNSWNVTTTALASRALMEEVSCTLYEADKISKHWSQAKSSPDDGREWTVHEFLTDKLLDFAFASRGLHDNKPPFPPPAINVITYIQKFAKRPGQGKIEYLYNYLSNAAHPAIGAKMAYSSHPSEHESRAYAIRQLSRQPPAEAHSNDWTFEIAWVAAKVAILFGDEGQRLLYQALSMVDDFGLTTRSGLLTLQPYWRKLMPGRRSSDACPCGCGKWRAAKHRWGQPAPEISLTG
jgi:hypothetical protein